MKKDHRTPPTMEPKVPNGIAIPEKTISLEKAVTYYNNFYHTRILHDPSDTTRAVWFEFTMLEQYFKTVLETCAKRNITITRFVFLLGADANGQRTVFLAPAMYDEGLDLHRAFSLDNDEITFLNRFPGEKYSTITNFEQLQSTAQSLILSSNGRISSAKAIKLYNNYYDVKTGPFTPIVEFDTRFVSYEIGEFEEYLNFLKLESVQKTTSITGVNAIFGAIEDSPTEGLYSNHITLFFAPTTGKQIKSCIFSFDTQNNTIINLSGDIWNLENRKINQTQHPCLFNHGSGGPPPPPHHWD